MAAVSIPGPVSRLDKKRIPEMAAELILTTKAISRRFGFMK